MAEYSRSIFCHPKEKGQFDLLLQSRDGIAHSAIGNLPRAANAKLQDVLTEAANRIRQLIAENTNWEEIGK